MDAPLSVLLRDNTHASATVRLALKAEQFSLQFSRSVIQIPMVQSSPTIFDLGQVRPTITISGLVDTLGGDATVTTSGFEGMESLAVSGPNGSGGTVSHPYYLPYKNYLETKLVTWVTDSSTKVQVEVGDSATPEGASHTGGGIYECAVQQLQFTLAPGTEDRWIYSISFAAMLRTGTTFP